MRGIPLDRSFGSVNLVTLMVSYPFKISLNTSQNRIAFLLAKALYYPLLRVFTAFAKVAVLTSRNNVCRRITTTSLDRDVMFLLQDKMQVKETWSMPAVSARTMPPFKRFLPMCICEVCGKQSFFGAASSSLFFVHFWVVIIVSLNALLGFFRMFQTPQFAAFASTFSTFRPKAIGAFFLWGEVFSRSRQNQVTGRATSEACWNNIGGLASDCVGTFFTARRYTTRLVSFF